MASNDNKRNKGWRRFQKLRFDKVAATKRLRKAESVSLRHAQKFVSKRWRNVKQVRRFVVLWLVSVACLVAASGIQLVWDRQSYQTTAGASGGTYVEALKGNVDTLNPLFADSPATEAVSQLVFSRLLTYDETGHLNYDLVSSIQLSKDQLAYDVVLRPDAKWHDGEPVTADDVMFTIDLMRDESSRISGSNWNDVEVIRIGDHELMFKLEFAYEPFRASLTFPIVPKHLLEDVDHGELRESAFSSSPVGSGPFSFSAKRDAVEDDTEVIHLTANEQYYRKVPRLSRFQIMAVPDDETMLHALSLNEVNSAVGLSQDYLSKVPTGRYKQKAQPTQAGVYAFLNNESSSLSDRQVRQALQLATDTDEVRQQVSDNVQALNFPYTNFQLEGSKPPSPPKFDLKKAASLLDKAGWTIKDGIREKDGESLRLSVVTTKNINYERALETLIGQWRQLGILVNERVIDATDPTQRFEQTVLEPRDYDVLIYQLALPDKDVYAYWHSSQKLNLANYSSLTADDMLSSARSTTSGQLRRAKQQSFIRQWLRDAPAIGLYQSTNRIIVAESVRGMSTESTLVTSEQHYADVSQWTVRERDVYRTP